jgi:hypothetical protein
MIPNYQLRFRCDCGAVYSESDIPKWPGPKGARWSYCPSCFEPEKFDNICDEPGCNSLASCGFPRDGGYRRTCREHYIKYGADK